MILECMALSIVSTELHQGQTRTAFFSDVNSFGSSALISASFNFVKIFALNYLDKVILRKHPDRSRDRIYTHSFRNPGLY